MTVLKLAFAGILAAAAVGVLWIEQGHRTVIEAPAAKDVASVAAVCPDNDTMPYDARCIEFLKVPGEPGPRLQVTMRKEPVAPAPCPDSDRVPYTASCIAFLKGATETGMRWRANDGPSMQR